MNLLEKSTAQFILKTVTDENDRLEVNEKLLDILHGNLLPHLKEKLQRDLGETWPSAISRAMPINFMKRIIDKMTHIYQTGVQRNVMPENNADQAKVDWYVNKACINDEFNYNNELFNLFGYSLQAIDTDNGLPFSTAVDNTDFIPVSLNRKRKNVMDMLILLMGKDDKGANIYWVWTSEQFAIIDSNEKVRFDLMREANPTPDLSDDELSVNPFGIIPYQYLTRSKSSIMPPIAWDTLQIALVVPLLLTDLNYISKYQTFSAIWTIDVKTEKLTQAPNAVWNFSTDEEDGSDKKPQIGTIKPEADIDKILTLISAQISMWLQTLGIRMGAIGDMNADNFQSGISKIIDEMDISDSRQKQASAYQKMEHSFWNMVMHDLDPIWVSNNELDNLHQFAGDAEVITLFPIQRPLVDRMSIIQEQKLEIEAGLTTRKRALKKVNPEMTDSEIEELLAEILEEQGTEEFDEETEEFEAQEVG